MLYTSGQHNEVDSAAVCTQGLGKTVQTIAFCAALLGKTGTSSDSLDLPPSSTVK